jgi:hypothetical protein
MKIRAEFRIRPLAESPLNRVKYYENCAFFTVAVFVDLCARFPRFHRRRNLCILLPLRNTCTILFFNLKSLAKYALTVTKVEAKHLLSSLSVGQVNCLRQTICLAAHPICKCMRSLSFAGGSVL